jgi:Fur family ferric uptake transcriptional regulator
VLSVPAAPPHGVENAQAEADTEEARAKVAEAIEKVVSARETEIAERLGFELVGHKLELYGKAIVGAEPSTREGLIFTRTARRVDPDKLDI